MPSIDFHLDNSEFETADGLILGGPWITVELSGNGIAFQVEAVRFTGTHTPVSTPAYDFIKLWAVEDVLKGSKSLIRQAYTDALMERDAEREDDRGCWQFHMRGAA